MKSKISVPDYEENSKMPYRADEEVPMAISAIPSIPPLSFLISISKIPVIQISPIENRAVRFQESFEVEGNKSTEGKTQILL
jgi:hypothetical protein